MFRRTLGAIQRRTGAPAAGLLRPNELRLDVVRAERLRREARRPDAIANPPRIPPEEPQSLRAPTAETGPARRNPDPSLVAALKSRSGLRQAWLVKEILGPPRALRGPSDYGSEA